MWLSVFWAIQCLTSIQNLILHSINNCLYFFSFWPHRSHVLLSFLPYLQSFGRIDHKYYSLFIPYLQSFGHIDHKYYSPSYHIYRVLVTQITSITLLHTISIEFWSDRSQVLLSFIPYLQSFGHIDHKYCCPSYHIYRVLVTQISQVLLSFIPYLQSFGHIDHNYYSLLYHIYRVLATQITSITLFYTISIEFWPHRSQALLSFIPYLLSIEFWSHRSEVLLSFLPYLQSFALLPIVQNSRADRKEIQGGGAAFQHIHVSAVGKNGEGQKYKMGVCAPIE